MSIHRILQKSPIRNLAYSDFFSSGGIRSSIPSRYSSSRQPLLLRTTQFSTSRHLLATPNMADDASYEAFLDKANSQSTTAKTASTSSNDAGFKALKASDAAVPACLNDVSETIYVSDADFAFEGVAFTFSGSLDKGTWATFSVSISRQLAKHYAESVQKLLGQTGIEVQSIDDFDPRRQYTNVVDKILEAAGTSSSRSEIKVFRVPQQGSRAEYFLLCCHKDGDKVVGARVKAVE